MTTTKYKQLDKYSTQLKPSFKLIIKQNIIMVTNNSKQIQIISSSSSSKQRDRARISRTNYTYITYMYNHILTIFAALITGFSREIASLPAAL